MSKPIDIVNVPPKVREAIKKLNPDLPDEQVEMYMELVMDHAMENKHNREIKKGKFQTKIESRKKYNNKIVNLIIANTTDAFAVKPLFQQAIIQ